MDLQNQNKNSGAAQDRYEKEKYFFSKVFQARAVNNGIGQEMIR